MEAVLIVVSRTFLLDRIIEWLNLNCPKDATYIFYCDNEPEKDVIESKISALNREKVEKYHTGRKPLQNYGRTSERRVRIAQIWNEILNEINIERFSTLFSVEDDTLPPEGAYRNLKSSLYNFDFITGVEVGRWGVRHLGIWYNKQIGDIEYLYSLPLQTGRGFISACGLYCFICKVKWLKDITVTGTHEAWGADVEMTLEIFRRGGAVVADYDVKCEHHDEYGKVILVEEPIEMFTYALKDGKCIAKGTSINIQDGASK